jgi:hypothetical protein
LGYVIFAELPDLWTWVGAAIIVASGIYVARREAAYPAKNTAAHPPRRHGRAQAPLSDFISGVSLV